MSNEVVIVDAVRSPIGKRKGGLAGLHPADLLGAVQRAAVERAGIDPAAVGQVIGGCVSQVGEQCFNIARTAWLAQGLPEEVAATTVDSQCGSSQQATTLATGLIGAGHRRRRPRLRRRDDDPGAPRLQRQVGHAAVEGLLREHYAYASQFQGAEMIAKEYGITREDTDRFGLRSQQLARQAWREDRFAREIAPVEAPLLDEERQTDRRDASRRPRRGPARDLAREARGSQGRRGRRRPHGRALRRRSPMAPPRCCSHRASAPRRWDSSRGPASSPRRWSVSTR